MFQKQKWEKSTQNSVLEKYLTEKNVCGSGVPETPRNLAPATITIKNNSAAMINQMINSSFICLSLPVMTICLSQKQKQHRQMNQQ